ncbi:hypothetical protein ACFQFH_12265 [Halobaculum halobium]|uniref:DUF7096 domain-containing protein n=1 Tax=Halobaculum halobium TaxID=3032281 RepID=A0ABD5TGI7_9EURY|nr:hypothetical protein [Halobaculum sp. SYNS20]
MSRTTVLLAVAMLVVAGIPATAAFAQESSGEQPGATFAGVVGVQGAEVEGEVAQRSLDRRLAGAESNASKAAVVAGETENARQQLSTLRERRETLEQRYQSGEITRGEYRSRLARIGAQIRTLEHRLNATAAAAEGIPEESLRERGVNASAIDELRRNASEMGGGEVAEAARGIGGADTGNGLAGDPGPPEDAGPPADAGPPGDNESGPPEDAGPPADAGPPGDNESGPPEDAGPPGDNESGPPEDAGPVDDDGDADDRGEGAAGPPDDDRGNANRSESGGENGEADDDGAGDRGNGNRTTDAGEADENGTDDAGQSGTPGETSDAADDRGNANDGDAAADGSSGTDAGDSSDRDGADGDGRENGNGPPDDGTATPTPSPEDDGDDPRVDDGRYLAPR